MGSAKYLQPCFVSDGVLVYFADTRFQIILTVIHFPTIIVPIYSKNKNFKISNAIFNTYEALLNGEPTFNAENTECAIFQGFRNVIRKLLKSTYNLRNKTSTTAITAAER